MELIFDGIESFFFLLLNYLGDILVLLPSPFGDPFAFLFMRRAFLTAVLVGIVCGVLSCFVVLKRWSLLGDAISHAVLPGVAVSYILNLPFGFGAFISGSIAALGIGFIERNSRIKQDAAMGIMLTAFFALGVVIISRIATSTHLMHILFGNVLGVRMETLIMTAGISFLALFLIWLFYKELVLYAFDPVHCTVAGYNNSFLHYGLMLLITLTIVASLETVGIILVVAMLITPGATAYLLTDRFEVMLFLSAFFGFVSAVAGLYISFFHNLASGGAIVLVSTSLFFVVFLFSPRHGIFFS